MKINDDWFENDTNAQEDGMSGIDKYIYLSWPVTLELIHETYAGDRLFKVVNGKERTSHPSCQTKVRQPQYSGEIHC